MLKITQKSIRKKYHLTCHKIKFLLTNISR